MIYKEISRAQQEMTRLVFSESTSPVLCWGGSEELWERKRPTFDPPTWPSLLIYVAGCILDIDATLLFCYIFLFILPSRGEIVAPFLITGDPIIFTFHDANPYFCLLRQFQRQTGGKWIRYYWLAAALIFLIFWAKPF